MGRAGCSGDQERLSPETQLRAMNGYPTEFSKVRLQYNYDRREDIPEKDDDHSVWLQFEFLLGAHAAHKF